VEWGARLAAAETRVAGQEADLPRALTELEEAPLDAWSRKGWRLDDAAWSEEDAHLERRADELAELAAVLRTVAEAAPLDPCTLLEGLAPPSFTPGLERVSPFQGVRAAELALLRAARDGDAAAVRRDLEALLDVTEHVAVPTSALYFSLWGFLAGHALTALEGAQAAGFVRDPAALEARLASWDPRGLLRAALERERVAGLRTLAWLAEQPEPPLGPRAFDEWNQGFQLAEAALEGRAEASEHLRTFLADASEPATLVLMPGVESQSKVARFVEARLALARTALRLQAAPPDERSALARELDPWTGAPLELTLDPDGSFLLRALPPEAPPDELERLRWTGR